MNIIDASRDPRLLGPYLTAGGDAATWDRWRTALRVLYGLPTDPGAADLIRTCTGRDPAGLPAGGFDLALFLTGRRSGKSRVAGLAAAYEAALGGHEAKLAPGERGLVAVLAPTKSQAAIVKNYVRAAFDAPMLAAELAGETREGFDLRSGVGIRVLAGDWRTVRGYTLVAAVVDEAAFFGLDENAKVKSDTELINAVRPALATTGGKLIAISTPYARKGWTWRQHKQHHGSDAGTTLVWNCPSRTMNPTLPTRVVDEAMREDPAAARAEYLGQFRDDVAEFLPRSLVEGLMTPGRDALQPRPGRRYVAFADMSGGRKDDSALAVAHARDGRVVVDCLLRVRPGEATPAGAAARMVRVLERYGVTTVTGDNYAAEWTAGTFRTLGVKYARCTTPKSGLYLELLPRLCGGEVELPDDPALLDQLAGLERRTRSGGRDMIDHPPGGHDDLANAVAGVCLLAGRRRKRAGALQDRSAAGGGPPRTVGTGAGGDQGGLGDALLAGRVTVSTYSTAP